MVEGGRLVVVEGRRVKSGNGVVRDLRRLLPVGVRADGTIVYGASWTCERERVSMGEGEKMKAEKEEHTASSGRITLVRQVITLPLERLNASWCWSCSQRDRIVSLPQLLATNDKRKEEENARIAGSHSPTILDSIVTPSSSTILTTTSVLSPIGPIVFLDGTNVVNTTNASSSVGPAVMLCPTPFPSICCARVNLVGACACPKTTTKRRFTPFPPLNFLGFG
jgi:hypothetical protein